MLMSGSGAQGAVCALERERGGGDVREHKERWWEQGGGGATGEAPMFAQSLCVCVEVKYDGLPHEAQG